MVLLGRERSRRSRNSRATTSFLRRARSTPIRSKSCEAPSSAGRERDRRVAAVGRSPSSRQAARSGASRPVLFYCRTLNDRLGARIGHRRVEHLHLARVQPRALADQDFGRFWMMHEQGHPQRRHAAAIGELDLSRCGDQRSDDPGPAHLCCAHHMLLPLSSLRLTSAPAAINTLTVSTLPSISPWFMRFTFVVSFSKKCNELQRLRTGPGRTSPKQYTDRIVPETWWGTGNTTLGADNPERSFTVVLRPTDFPPIADNRIEW